MNRSQLIPYLALPVVALVGFALGRLETPEPGAEKSVRADSGRSGAETNGATPGGSVESVRTLRESTMEDEVSGSRGTARIANIERLRMLSQDGVGKSGILKVLSITSQLSAEEIPAALALAKQASGDLREVMLISALWRWAELDPQAAAEGALALKGREGNEAVELALTEWAQRDAGAARAWIDALAKEEQPGAIRGYLAGLALHDPAAALREAAAMPSGNSGQTYEAIFSSWAARDPRTASVQAATLPDGVRDNALKAIVGTWGRTDPIAALAWARTLPHEKDRLSSVGGLLRKLCATDPHLAIQQTLSLPEELRDSAAPQLIDSLMHEGVEQARTFAESLPAGKGRDLALATVAARWARTDPQEAAQFLLSQPANPAMSNTISVIAQSWGQRDGVAAGRWVAQLPESPSRVAATGCLIDTWASRDPVAAAKWVEQLPAGLSRDAAASAYARKVRSTDPAAAMDWAATVTDTTQRERTVRDVLEAWRKRDRAAAQRWIESTTVIADDLRSVLLRGQ
jgi:hypothetical protein